MQMREMGNVGDGYQLVGNIGAMDGMGNRGVWQVLGGGKMQH